MSDSHYPLCDKYKAPHKDGVVDWADLQVWKEQLPANWPERFSNVCGPVTCTEKGIYACDVEDTLWALERNISFRRWNG